MSKMKLDLDALQVDTFHTLSRYEGTGTVYGHEQDEPGAATGMGQRTCASCPEITCAKPCDPATGMGERTCASCPEITCVQPCDPATGMGQRTCASCPEITCVKACD